MAASYCTLDQFDAWASPFTASSDADLELVLERASRDIDAYLWLYAEPQEDGSVFGDPAANPLGLTDAQLVRLRRATAAQAFHRLTMGEDWALGGGDLLESVTGPDFGRVGRRPRLSAQAVQELRGSGLLVRTARVVG